MTPAELELERERARARARARARGSQGWNARTASDLRAFADERTLPAPERSRPLEEDPLPVTYENMAEGDSRWAGAVRNVPAQIRRIAGSPVRAAADTGEGLVDFGARFAAEVLDNPVETLTYPLTAPYRAGTGYWDTMTALQEGEYGTALDRGMDTATAALETAVLTVPAGGRPRAQPRQAMRDAVRDFDRSNVEPYAAGVAAGTPASGAYGPATKVTAENIIAGMLAREQLQRRAVQSQAQAERLADARSTTARTAAEGGEAVRSGVERFARETFPREANRRYGRVNSQVRGSAASSTRQTRRMLAALNAPFRSAMLSEATRNPRLAGLQEILENTAKPGELSGRALHFTDLQRLRSEIRRMRTDQPLMRNVRDADLARLESALTYDIYQGIQGAARAMYRRGDPARNAAAQQALADLQAANAWYRQTARIIARDLEPFNTQTAEGAFRTVRSSAQGRGRGAIQQLRSLRDSLEPAAWRDVSATILRDMADVDGRGFSPARWATAWERMSPEAKELLFGQTGNVARENLEAFYRTMRRTREFEGYSNFSNSARSAQTLATGASLAAPQTFLPSLMLHAAWMAGGRLLMSPNFTRLLAEMGAATSIGADVGALYGRQYSALVALSRLEPEYAADYRRVLEALPPPEDILALPPPTRAPPALEPAIPR